MKKKFVFVCFCCMCVMFVNAQELEKGVQNAVNRLADRLTTRLTVSIDPLTLDDETTKSSFSRQLYDMVLDYATKAPLFNVVIKRGPGSLWKPGEPPRGTIKGTFAQRGNRVEVFLYLVSDVNGTSLGSHRFSFPLAELPEGKDALVPENNKEVDEREKIFAGLSVDNPSGQSTTPASKSSTNQNIHIQAFFNSESMTYLHRDELRMTVMADRNCYFKVIHIDVNNQMKMIYPNSSDRNNELRANTPREIFETLAWRIYAPYGAETILLVASSQQFEKIDQEYNAPWKPMTADAIRTAVRGNRGVDYERKTPITFSGEGEARYTITTLKPHELYSYSRPENMEEFLKTMRNDVVDQGGKFDDDSSETSGSYIINGVRGSYRVPSNSPDTIEFAMYNLANFTGGSRAGARTRGAEHTFKIDRPANIAQAIRMVRSSIEGSGGTFTGNEQQGNFRAKGITGQYRVSNMVDVTITEKPLVVPNSLIEKEVKSYFGGR